MKLVSRSRATVIRIYGKRLKDAEITSRRRSVICPPIIKEDEGGRLARSVKLYRLRFVADMTAEFNVDLGTSVSEHTTTPTAKVSTSRINFACHKARIILH